MYALHPVQYATKVLFLNQYHQEWYLGDKDDKFLQVPKGTIRRLTGIFLQYIDDPIKIQ